MPTDKEIKKIFKEKASREPDKYYATSILKGEGFIRKKCKKCVEIQVVVGDTGL